MNKITDYVIALTNLYGIVHKDKVIEIFNMQNEKKITDLVDVNKNSLNEFYVEIYGDYYIAQSIKQFNEFDEQMNLKRNKPYYIPNQNELLKYKDQFYFEKTEEYDILLDYLTEHFFDDDIDLAEGFVDHIQGFCQFGFSLPTILDEFNQRKLTFKNEDQIQEVLNMIGNLANHTRIWENNGYTPHEIFVEFEKPKLRPLPKEGTLTVKKIGRNDPCPCGSGKKYKKCCLDN